MATIAVERALRRADDRDAAHQLIRAAVDEDTIDDQRLHRKRLRTGALGDREAGGDVFEVEAIGLALLLRFSLQHLPQLAIRDGLRRGDDQVALAPGGHVARLRAAVAVAGAEVGDRKTRHQEGFKHAILDQVDLARGLAFVVVNVVAAQRGAIEAGQGGGHPRPT